MDILETLLANWFIRIPNLKMEMVMNSIPLRMRKVHEILFFLCFRFNHLSLLSWTHIIVHSRTWVSTISSAFRITEGFGLL